MYELKWNISSDDCLIKFCIAHSTVDQIFRFKEVQIQPLATCILCLPPSEIFRSFIYKPLTSENSSQSLPLFHVRCTQRISSGRCIRCTACQTTSMQRNTPDRVFVMRIAFTAIVCNGVPARSWTRALIFRPWIREQRVCANGRRVFHRRSRAPACKEIAPNVRLIEFDGQGVSGTDYRPR